MSTSERAVMPCGWGVKAGIWFVCGWQVKLYPLVTHGPYLSALEMHRDKAIDTFTLLNQYAYLLIYSYLSVPIENN